MVPMSNELRTLRSVVSSLEKTGLAVLVFGGWAEELQGMVPARTHQDIDLLLLDPDVSVLDEFLGATLEVLPKRSSHKRAFKRRAC